MGLKEALYKAGLCSLELLHRRSTDKLQMHSKTSRASVSE